VQLAAAQLAIPCRTYSTAFVVETFQETTERLIFKLPKRFFA
jgi:hypothetical protein